MATRPTTTEPTNEMPWYEGAQFIHSLGNGCAVKVEMVPHGSIGFPGTELGGLKSPLADLDVDDLKFGWGVELGPLTATLNFDLIFSCGRYKSLCLKGCTGTAEMNIEVEIDIDFMLPEGPDKEKFKECLEGANLDFTCVQAAKQWLERLGNNKELPQDFYDMMADPVGWWTQGMPFIGGPPNPGGNQIRNGIMKAMAVIMSDLFNEYKVDQMKSFLGLCQCGEVSVSEQKDWIRETEEIIKAPNGPLHKWEGIMQTGVISAYNEWAESIGNKGVPIDTASIVWSSERPTNG